VGWQHHRSPPVSISELTFPHSGIPGLFPEWEDRSTLRNIRELPERWETGGPGPRLGTNINQQWNGCRKEAA